MALTLLLDEQMSPVVAEQAMRICPELIVESVQLWRSGVLRSKRDEQVLRAARDERLTLVTYDVSTIAPLLVDWAANGEDHAGVIFIDNRTVAQDDLGGQTAALIEQWRLSNDWDWTNLAIFLRPAKH